MSMGKMQQKPCLFVSDCAQFIAIRIKDSVPSFEDFHFDVIRVDGSEKWHGTRYAKTETGGFVPRHVVHENNTLLSERFVGGWSNRYRGNKEGFRLYLYRRGTNERHTPEFHRPIKSLAPHHRPREEQL